MTHFLLFSLCYLFLFSLLSSAQTVSSKPKTENSIDCITFPNTICIGTGDSKYTLPLSPLATSDNGLAAYYNFDELINIDRTKNNPPFIGTNFAYGPGFPLSTGASLYISNSNFSSDVIIHGPVVGISFAIFVFSVTPGSFSSILTIDNKFNKGVQILLWPGSTKLRVQFSLFGIDSLSTLPLNSWSIVNVWIMPSSDPGQDPLLKLYINGILDSESSLPRSDVFYLAQTEDIDNILTLGSVDMESNWKPAPLCYFDELKLYSKPSLFYLYYNGWPNFGIGCTDCTLETAITSCKAGFTNPINGMQHRSRHLCTKSELHGGGLNIARELGWIATDNPGLNVWEGEMSNDDALVHGLKTGVGLCCSD